MKNVILLSILSFGANAEMTEGELNARCLAWSIAAGFSADVSMGHATKARETLSSKQMMYQAGVADGLVLASKELGDKKEVSRGLYAKVCKED